MKLSQKLGILATGYPAGKRAQAIIEQIHVAGVRGAAKQSTADSAMLHMVRHERGVQA